MEEVLHIDARLLLLLLLRVLRVASRGHRLRLRRHGKVQGAGRVGHHAVGHHHGHHRRQDRRVVRLLLLPIRARRRLDLREPGCKRSVNASFLLPRHLYVW